MTHNCSFQMSCSTNFSFHYALNCLANMADNSGINAGKAKPSCFNFPDGDVEKLHKFFIDQGFRRFGKVRRHGHGKGSFVTLQDKVACPMVIHSVKVCLDQHAGNWETVGFGLVVWFGEIVKLVFREQLYSIGEAVCFLIGFLANRSR